MKKLLLPLFLGALLLTYFSCRKSEHPDQLNATEPFVTEAVNFLQSKISRNELESLDFENYSLLKDEKGNPSIIRFVVKGGPATKFIVVGKMNNVLEGNWVDGSKLNIANNISISGVLGTNSFDNNEKSAMSFNDNKIVKIAKTVNGKTNTTLIRYEKGKPIFTSLNQAVARGEDMADFLHKMFPEVIVYATPQVPVTYYSVYYMMNLNPAYLYSYSTSPYLSGGIGSGAGGGIANLPMVFSPDKPVKIGEELKCFSSGAEGSSFKISINVNQPSPGNRTIFNPIASHQVGHTYLTLTQTKANGQEVVRSVGFYPATSAKPGSETDNGTFGDDSNMPYSVGLQVSVSGTEFQKVINSLINQGSMLYQLQSYNCTTAAVVGFAAIPINLPETFGIVPLATVAAFYGMNPGDLGEDIRGLNEVVFSAQYGNRTIVITRSNNNDKLPASRKGPCP